MIAVRGKNRDDVSIAHSVEVEVGKDYGEKVVNAFRNVFSFDPPLQN